MGESLNIPEEKLLEAIKDSYGIMSTIAERLGVSWKSAERWINKYESTIEAYECEKEIMLDDAESVVVNSMKKDDIQTAKWLLSVKGKKRGYSEKIDVEHSGKVDIDIAELREELSRKLKQIADKSDSTE